MRKLILCAVLAIVLSACGSTSDTPDTTTTTAAGPTTTSSEAPETTTTEAPHTTTTSAPKEPGKGTLRVCEVAPEGSAGERRSTYTEDTFAPGDRYRSTSPCSDAGDRMVSE